jgi:hypothetical protein
MATWQDYLSEVLLAFCNKAGNGYRFNTAYLERLDD